jgi:hypothetical protein
MASFHVQFAVFRGCLAKFPAGRRKPLALSFFGKQLMEKMGELGFAKAGSKIGPLTQTVPAGRTGAL